MEKIKQESSKLDLIATFLIGISFLILTTLLLVNLEIIPNFLCTLNMETKEYEKTLYKELQMSVLPDPRDEFEDLARLLGSPVIENETVRRIVIVKENSEAIAPRTFGNYFNLPPKFSRNSLLQFHLGINEHSLYNQNDDPLLMNVLQDLATKKIIKMGKFDKVNKWCCREEILGTTHFNLIAHFNNGMKAIFKPIRFPRDEQTNENHFYLSDYERANAEIAAFHLDRILGFHRALPTVGRKINLFTELFNVTTDILKRTFFKSPINNTCFFGNKCWLYCDDDHSICGDSEHNLEGAFTAFLPEPMYLWTIDAHNYPWSRAIDFREKTEWELDDGFCNKVIANYSSSSPRLLLDFADMAVFDFLMGNLNRRYFYTFQLFGQKTYLLHVNQARGFGKPFIDDLSILAPIYQCCHVRYSTLRTLLNFHNGPEKLSTILERSLTVDPIAPVLWEPHFDALDRRVEIVLNEIRKCIHRNN